MSDRKSMASWKILKSTIKAGTAAILEQRTIDEEYYKPLEEANQASAMEEDEITFSQETNDDASPNTSQKSSQESQKIVRKVRAIELPAYKLGPITVRPKQMVM